MRAARTSVEQSNEVLQRGNWLAAVGEAWKLQDHRNDTVALNGTVQENMQAVKAVPGEHRISLLSDKCVNVKRESLIQTWMSLRCKMLYSQLKWSSCRAQICNV